MEILQSRIESILRTEDIESLFQHGAPSDEYSLEARAIVAAVARLSPQDATEGLIADLILNIWNHAFGPFSDYDLDLRRPTFQSVARQMLVAQPPEQPT